MLAVLAGPVAAKPADAPLAERLVSPDDKIRRLAAEQAENLRPEQKLAYLPQLLALIGDSDPNVEGAALRAICVMGSPAKQAIPIIIRNFALSRYGVASHTKCLRIFGGVLVLTPVMKALDDEKYLIRKGALLTLKKLAHEAEPALPRLRALLAASSLRLDVSRADEAPRIAAVDLTKPVRAAIKAIEARPTLAERLLSEDRSVRFSAVFRVKALSPDGTIRYLDTLIRLLGDKDSTIRGIAGQALCDLGTRGESAIPTLIQAFAVPVGEEAIHHARCVAEFGTRALPYLIGALDDPNPFIVRHSLDVLRQLGPDAAPALPVLRKLAEQRKFRYRTREVIATLTAPPTLMERVESTDEIIRWRALREVRALPPAKRVPYVPYYVDYLWRNEGINQFPAVARMLCETGPPAKAAIPVLIRRFVETHTRQYVDCVSGFGVHAVTALIDALSDKKYLIRLRAIEALQQIGPPARAALPALSALSRQPSVRLDVSAYAYPPKIETVTLVQPAKRAIAAISADTDPK